MFSLLPLAISLASVLPVAQSTTPTCLKIPYQASVSVQNQGSGTTTLTTDIQAPVGGILLIEHTSLIGHASQQSATQLYGSKVSTQLFGSRVDHAIGVQTTPGGFFYISPAMDGTISQPNTLYADP